MNTLTPTAITKGNDPTKAAGLVANPVAAFNPGFKIENLEKEVPILNMLIYGTFGSGKTTLAATASDVPEMADVLLIDVESGRMSIHNNDRIKQRANIDIVRITSFKQLAAVHKYLLAHCRLRDKDDDTKLRELEARFKGVEVSEIVTPRKYRTVVIDSITELDQLCIYELLGFTTDMDLDKAMSGGDMKVPEWAEYRKNNQMMQLIIRSYRDLPMSAIFTAHVDYTQDELKRFHYTPQMTGKLASQVQGFMDIVGYLVVGQMLEGQTAAPRRLFVQPAGKFDAKNRKSAFKESFFDDPYMTTIWSGVNLKTNKQPNKQ